MTPPARLLPRALALFPLFVLAWALLAVGAVVWLAWELCGGEEEEG